MQGGGLQGLARWPLLYKPRTFLSFLASELRLGSLGLCVVINGNLKQRELTISFFISLCSPPPPHHRLPTWPRAQREIQLPRIEPRLPLFCASCYSRLPSFANKTKVHRTRAPQRSYDERRVGGRLKCDALIYTEKSEGKKCSKLFRTGEGNRSGKIYFSFPAGFFYTLSFSLSKCRCN